MYLHRWNGEPGPEIRVTGPGGFDVGDVFFGPESYGAERDEEGVS